MTRAQRIGLFGGPLDTGNCGVTALGLGTIRGLVRSGVPCEVTLFDSSPGVRRTRMAVEGRVVEVRHIGYYSSRRVYRTDNLAQIRLATRLRVDHPALEVLRDLDAVLDLSSGDAFTDLYGMRGFRGQCLPKQIALRLGIPLVLLPQTYGPFRRARSRAAARAIMDEATQVWARDSHSARIAESLRSDARATPVHRGIDVAFGLQPRRPDDATAAAVLDLHARCEVLVGLNVNGLLYNGTKDRTRFGYRDAYRDLVHGLIEALAQRRGVQVLLVPHVLASRPAIDCDGTACSALLARLPKHLHRRVVSCPPGLGPAQRKWVIGRCDFFCGARMHACIAALSQAVATVGIAYSDKMSGVFEDLRVPEAVIDPRSLDSRQSIERILTRFRDRAATQQVLQSRQPVTQATLDRQFSEIVSALLL